MHCARVLVREYGVSALYHGYVINTVREIIFCCIYFGVYENWKRNLATVEQSVFSLVGVQRSKEASPFAILVSGMLDRSDNSLTLERRYCWKLSLVWKLPSRCN